MTTPRALSTTERRNLEYMGWTLGTTYATRTQTERHGGIVVARLTITPAGAWTVDYTDGTKPASHSGQEACIFGAAMEANECAWAIRDGVKWLGSIAATYAARYPENA